MPQMAISVLKYLFADKTKCFLLSMEIISPRVVTAKKCQSLLKIGKKILEVFGYCNAIL